MENGDIQRDPSNRILTVTGQRATLRSVYSEQKMREALVKFVVTERLSFHNIESSSFREFCQLLRPDVKLVGADQIRHLTVDYFSRMRGTPIALMSS
jgi:hypothetical protein